MKVKYELDKDKFIKVYNELKIDTGNVPDYYGLASKYDKTNDKDIKEIMYAIDHNINFEILDINAVKKINEMYNIHKFLSLTSTNYVCKTRPYVRSF